MLLPLLTIALETLFIVTVHRTFLYQRCRQKTLVSTISIVPVAFDVENPSLLGHILSYHSMSFCITYILHSNLDKLIVCWVVKSTCSGLGK